MNIRDFFNRQKNREEEGRFHDFMEFTLNYTGFSSFRVAIDGAVRMAQVFDAMPKKDRHIPCFDPEGLLLDMESGKIRWDRDSSLKMEDIRSTHLMRYLAPEMIAEGAPPDDETDRYLLGVLIFQILTWGQHPMEGKAMAMPVIDGDHRERIYGQDAAFIFDHDRGDNRPVLKLNYEAIALWDRLSGGLKDLFRRCFDGDSSRGEEKRPSPQEWLSELIFYQNHILVCNCGNVVFASEDERALCPLCGQDHIPGYMIYIGDRMIPAFRGNRIYGRQIRGTKATDADVCARVVSSHNDVGKLGIQNMLDGPIEAKSTKGEIKEVEPGAVIPLKDGIEFCMGKTYISIKSVGEARGEEENER